MAKKKAGWISKMSETNAYQFSVEGMSCSHCLSKVRQLGLSEFGASDIAINLDRGTVKLAVDGEFDPDQFIGSLKKLGFQAHSQKSEPQSADLAAKSHHMLARIGVAGACAGNIMLISFALYSGADMTEFFGILSWLSFALFLPILFYSAYPILKQSYTSLVTKRPSVDIPLAVAIVGGTALSVFNLFNGSDQFYFDSLSIFVFLILSSRYFIYKLQQKHLKPISISNVFGKDKVQVVVGEQARCLPIEELQTDDIFVLQQEDHVPTDCVLVSPQAVEINTAILTGESEPQKVNLGQSVSAGSQLYSQFATFKALSPSQSSGLSRLIERVNSAIHNKTGLSLLTDRVATYFTYVILSTVTVLIMVSPLLGIDNAFDRVLALLVLSCPCALAIATPLAFSLAIKRAFHNGLLIKKAEVFERAKEITSIGFDKTGTLTTGVATVSGWAPRTPNNFEKSIIGSLEKGSAHPVAKAIVNDLGPFELLQLTARAEIAGKGVTAQYQGNTYTLFKAVDSELTEVIFAKNEEQVLRIRIETEVRAETKSVLASLSQQDYQPFVLTGDTAGTAGRLAEKLKLPSELVCADLSPEQKASKIDELGKTEKVAFVGDGINDCLALAKSHLALSMGGSPEVTFRSSDVHILDEDLRGVSKLIELSNSTYKVVKASLALSLAYNVVFGALAVSGLINPFFAAVLMPISSITVVGLTVFMMPTDQPLQRISE
jgi:heavy metal translocating P-type ATPase